MGWVFWIIGPMPKTNDVSVSYLARTNFRNSSIPFGIKHADRFSHVYVIGKTGTGKTTLIENMARQDIAAGHGLTLIDPHGDLVSRIAASIPQSRQQDTIYFDVPNSTQPYGYNPLRSVQRERRALAASGIMEVFKTTWDARSWGGRMEHVLRNTLLALLDQQDATLGDVPRLLTDRSYRIAVGREATHPPVRDFWLNEFPKYSHRYQADSIAPILNKVGSFLADPRLYRILTRPERPLSLRRIMDDGQILLVNLARGQIGSDSAALLGGLLVTTVGLAAFSRADTPEAERRPFFLYVDEFQNFTTLSVATMASELRKYGIGLILAHQYLDQLEPDVRHAVLGNAGTLISFRLGAHDTEHVAREFEPKFSRLDLLNLPNHDIYLKLMIDGTPSKPFSASTFPPILDT